MIRFSRASDFFDQRRRRRTVSTLHHLACTGGTIISKSLAAMTGCYLLSEIHPYVTRLIRFDPMAAAAQFQSQYASLSPPEARSALAAQIAVIAKRAAADGRRLVIRDHAHSDFCTGSATFEPSLLTALREVRLKITSAVTIRDPLESYISLSNNDWTEGLDFDQYCETWQKFLATYDGCSVYRYEDFCQSPESFIKGLCEDLGVCYQADFRQRIGELNMSGDSGRSSNLIEPRSNKPVPEHIVAQVKTSEHYAEIQKKWPAYRRDFD